MLDVLAARHEDVADERRREEAVLDHAGERFVLAVGDGVVEVVANDVVDEGLERAGSTARSPVLVGTRG